MHIREQIRRDTENQSSYALYSKACTLIKPINGIPVGTEGKITQVRPGWLGSAWTYVFMADNWAETRHPFTRVTIDFLQIHSQF